MTKQYHRITIPRYIVLSLAIAVLTSLAVLVARGCAMARDARFFQANKGREHNISLLVYDHREKKTVRMPLEEYLVGVVAGEMPASFEEEAIRAQAVAARTYTVCHMAAFGGATCAKGGADLCTDSSCCQAWKNDSDMRARWGKDYETNKARIQAAVQATTGEIIVYDGEPIEALYHSNSGGFTEDAVNVFQNARPYLVSVISPGEEGAAHFETTQTFTCKEFINKVNREWKNAKLSDKNLEKQVKVRSRFESGRVEALQLGEVTVTGREMRKLFSLNSANFTIKISDADVAITTKGYGHGVGMSQHGANAMAKGGKGYIAILTHYYKGTEIIHVLDME